MAIPDFQTLMLPALRLAGDEAEHALRDAVAGLADEFKLDAEERASLLPSGGQTVIHNRVAWSVTYLKKAGLLEAPRRGIFRITAAGKDVLASKPDRIDIRFLSRFPEFAGFRSHSGSTSRKEAPSSESEGEQTPEERLEEAYAEIRASLGQDLIARVQNVAPEFFERLVIDLLVRMGYGGSRADAGERLGRTGDEGIDGIIKEDRLGLDLIYIQAKRWKDTVVGRPEIQKFLGAIQGHHARKGVFITTSTFSRDAREFVERLEARVILIDGEQLANLMMDFDVGVSTVGTFGIKRIDSDFFEQG